MFRVGEFDYFMLFLVFITKLFCLVRLMGKIQLFFKYF